MKAGLSTLIRTGLGLLVAAFLVHAASSPIGWGDFFWQEKTGELIWTTRAIPHVDPFAWTTAGKDWVEHEWLTGLGYFALHRAGGLLAVRLFFAALWLVGTARLYAALRRAGDEVTAGLGVAAFLVLVPRQFVPAPSTLSLFISLAITLVWAPWRVRRSLSRIAAVTAIFFMWCNMHSQALLALGFFALHAAVPTGQRIVGRWLGAPSSPPPSSDRWVLLASCTAVSFLTPYTWHVHAYALHGPNIARLIDEWVPLLEGNYVAAPTKALVVLVAVLMVASIAWRLARRGWRDVVMSESLFYDICALACLWLALRHGRFVWIVMVPIAHLAHLHAEALRRVPAAIGAATVAACLAGALATYGWSPRLLAGVFTKVYFQHDLRERILPVGAADFLRANHLEGRLFNHYEWGGYLIYRLYPDYRVFVDGRTVLHGAGIIEDEMRISRGAPETPALLDRYGIQILVVGPNYFSADMARKLGWSLRYRDEAAAVFYRDAVPR